MPSRRLIIPLLFLLQSLSAIAQKEDANWCFALNVGFTFNTQPPSSFWQTMYANESSASISDPSGKLLFFSDGQQVWNRNQAVMQNGYGLNGNSSKSSLQGVSILQYPGKPGQYFLLTASDLETDPNPAKLYLKYSIIDMSLDNGLGGVVAGQKSIIVDSFVSESITLAGNGTCNNRIIVHDAVRRNFKVYEVSTAGINPMPVISPAGTSADVIGYGMMRLSNDERTLAYSELTRPPVTNDLFTTIWLFDYDHSTGVISNGRIVAQNDSGMMTWGMAFSPDNSKLYYPIVDYTDVSQRTLVQLDLDAGSTADIRASKTIVDTNGSYGYDLRTGPDSRIYGAAGAFSCIPHPDLKAPFCGFIDSVATQAAGSMTFFTFPGYVLSPKSSFVHDAILCPGRQLTAPATGLSYLWNTGEQTASILPMQAGVYWVKTMLPCGERLDSFTIQILQPQQLRDTILCNGDSLLLHADFPEASYLWQDGSTGSSYMASHTGVYIVNVSLDNCVVSDTAYIQVFPAITGPLLPPDPLLCAGDYPYTITALLSLPQYNWSDGSHGTQLQVHSPGTYWLSVSTPCGSYSDTIYIAPPPVGRFNDSSLTVPYGTQVQLPACGSSASIQWYHDDSLVCSGCTDYKFAAKEWHAVYYCVLQQGTCSDTCRYLVTVTDIPDNIWMPDAFTPNGDGRNDGFGPGHDNPNIHVLNFSVYNRWGQRVFYSISADEKWDGSFHGSTADMGTYYWMLDAEVAGTNSGVRHLKGEVVLVR